MITPARPKRQCAIPCVLALLLSSALATRSLDAQPASAGSLSAGAAVVDITPPIGTPSAGYGARRGAGMTGVHDPLLATALVLDNGAERVALVGVDHLGFDHSMVEEVRQLLAAEGQADLELFLGSSHTHAGAGAYLDIPVLGQILAGTFDASVRQTTIEGAAQAVLAALGKIEPARLGLGRAVAPGLSRFRSDWPPHFTPSQDVTVLSVESTSGTPLAVWFHYAAHATVLPAENMEFSADFVGSARNTVREALGGDVVAIYFNGAQADVSPVPPGDAGGPFERAAAMGAALGSTVLRALWEVDLETDVAMKVARLPYDLRVEATSAGSRLPFENRSTELGLLVLDERHALVAVPGELTAVYEAELQRTSAWLGFDSLTVLGLTNDAQGYILHPAAWREQTYESTVSFGGERYGTWMRDALEALLHAYQTDATKAAKAHRSKLLGPP